MPAQYGKLTSAKEISIHRSKAADSGSYLLGIAISRELVLHLGKRGTFRIPPGYAVYAGTARASLKARIARHRKKRKKKHWHIDYLLVKKAAFIQDVWIFPGPENTECQLIKKLLSIKGAEVPIKGFGATDCKSNCKAHLVWFKQKPDMLDKGVIS
jgi:sugar fermentation stimulation protein A